MSIRPEEIIHELIFQPQTAWRLAYHFEVTEEEMVPLVMELFLQGSIAPSSAWGGDAWGDVVCTNLNCRQAFERCCELPREPCSFCGGWVKDVCCWRYIGGPVSEALAAAA